MKYLKLFENKLEDNLILKIQSVLTDDLLIPYWQKHKQPNDHPLFGHCYAASEALFHLLGGKNAGYVPMRSPSQFGTHWWIRDKNGNYLDPTAEQFTSIGIKLPYDKGIGAGFLTGQKPSKRALEIIKRVNNINENFDFEDDEDEENDIYLKVQEVFAEFEDAMEYLGPYIDEITIYCINYVNRKMKNKSWKDYIDGDGKLIDNVKETIQEGFIHWASETRYGRKKKTEI